MKKVLRVFAALTAAALCLTALSCNHSPKKKKGGSIPDDVIPPRGVDYSAAKIGDIVLADGTYVSKDDFDSTAMTGVAVIYREASLTDCALGIALKESTAHTPWCLSTAVGYGSVPALGTGLRNSTDSYKKLLEVCGSDLTAVEKYPAWEYCATYGAVNGFSMPFTAGWCLPTVSELSALKTSFSTVASSLTKANGMSLKYASSVKTGIDPSTRQDLKTNTYYVACNQNGNNAYLSDIESQTTGNKETGRTQFLSSTITIKMIARPVYHFENDENTLSIPVISDKKDGAVVIDSYDEDVIICYQVDDGDWKEAQAPAKVTLDSSEHTIVAHARLDGLEDSAPASKTIPTDPVM